MSDSKKILVLVSLILGLGILVFKSSQLKTSEGEAETGIAHSAESAAVDSGDIQKPQETTKQVVASGPAPEPAVQAPSTEALALRNTPLNEKEIKSVTRLSGLLGQVAGVTNSSVQGMINKIKSLGLVPDKSVDENPYTGRMTMIRTSNALPGTRYLHVQMPGMNPKDEFVQTISFQIRPGKDSFSQALELMKKSLPAGSQIKQQSEDFVQWSIPGAKEARVEVLNTMDQLRASKYDAVSKDDIGAVKVTVELSIHEVEGEHSDL